MRIYFTSDIHASERCWRKFLATPRHYGVDVIIVGGDITGKSIVPVMRENGSWRATFAGEGWRSQATTKCTSSSGASPIPAHTHAGSTRRVSRSSRGPSAR